MPSTPKNPAPGPPTRDPAFGAAAWRRALAALAVGFAVLSPALAQPAPAEPSFDILEFVVEGDTVLGAVAIERAVYPFLGPARSAADAEGARRALQQAYQAAGFLSVSVLLPPQRVDGGEVRLVVQQAPVERLRVTGAEHFLPSQIRDGVPSLAPGSVPQFGEVQQELALLAAAAPDRQITPLLAAGSRPGTLDVELKVEDRRPLNAVVELNSKQAQNTERGRLEAAVSYDNLFQRQHGIAANWLVAPADPSQANILSLLYSLPLGGPGDRLSLAFTTSDSDTPTPLGGLTVSRGDTWRLRWRDQLDAPDGLRHALSWGITQRRLQDRNVDVGGFSTESPALVYPTFHLDYELGIAWAKAGRETRLSASSTFSLPGLSARSVDCFGVPADQFACKRAAASARFQVLGVGAEHREPLAGGSDGWLLELRLQGQVTDTPLPSSEQVVYGGSDSVRGYFEGEQSGDLGLALRAEVWAPRLAVGGGTALRLIAFVDRAQLHRLYALPAEPARVALGSAGLGLRVDTGFGLAATLDWARLLYDTARLDRFGSPEPLSGAAAGRGSRWELSVRQRF
jgi:hemolysin activation/secretion protein